MGTGKPRERELCEHSREGVINDATGKPFTVRYHLLVPLLLAEVQRQDEELAELRRIVANLRRNHGKLPKEKRFGEESVLGRRVARLREDQGPSACSSNGH